MKRVNVIENDGVIKYNDITLTNKCFYLCIKEGLKRIGINTDAMNLRLILGDKDFNSPFDLDQLEIQNKFALFFNLYSQVKIVVYIDNGRGNRIVDTSMYVEIVHENENEYNNGLEYYCINILKCVHSHFEYITDFVDIALPIVNNLPTPPLSSSINHFDSPNIDKVKMLEKWKNEESQNKLNIDKKIEFELRKQQFEKEQLEFESRKQQFEKEQLTKRYIQQIEFDCFKKLKVDTLIVHDIQTEKSHTLSINNSLEYQKWCMERFDCIEMEKSYTLSINNSLEYEPWCFQHLEMEKSYALSIQKKYTIANGNMLK